MSTVHFLYNNAGPGTPAGQPPDIWCSCRWHFGSGPDAWQAAVAHIAEKVPGFRLNWVLEGEQVRVLLDTLARESHELARRACEVERRMGWRGYPELGVRRPSERGLEQLRAYWDALGKRKLLIDKLRESLGPGPGTPVPPWPDYESEGEQ